MTSSPDPREAADDDAGDRSGGRKLYESGPWLVLVSHGVEADEAAQAARRQCRDRGVDVDVRPIDEFHNVPELAFYTGLVIVLPSAVPPTARTMSTLRRVVRLVNDYRRSSRKNGISSLSRGRLRWYQVGVVQLVAIGSLIELPDLQEISPKVCKVHRLDGGPESTSTEVDFFRIYDQIDAGAATQDHGNDDGSKESESARERETIWTAVRAWGITSKEQVRTALAVIDECRNLYSSRDHHGNPKFRAMIKPHPDSEWNRLEITLFAPNTPSPPGQHKKWTENGARGVVCLRERLSEAIPGICRPGGRAGTKDEQLAYHQLYSSLIALSISPEFQEE